MKVSEAALASLDGMIPEPPGGPKRGLCRYVVAWYLQPRVKGLVWEEDLRVQIQSFYLELTQASLCVLGESCFWLVFLVNFLKRFYLFIFREREREARERERNIYWLSPTRLQLGT